MSLLVETRPDDDLFAPWCEVWAASARADRSGERPRPASDHVALARQLLTPGGSRAGTHRAAVVDGAVVGALRLILPVARAEGFSRVMITCDDDNDASRKVILANGGVPAGTVPHLTRPGHVKLSFWVSTLDG